MLMYTVKEKRLSTLNHQTPIIFMRLRLEDWESFSSNFRNKDNHDNYKSRGVKV